MSKTAKSFLFFLLFLTYAFSVHAETLFNVTIETDQNSVKQGMMFLVHTQVTNATEDSVELWVHSCAYDKPWETDNDNVHIQSWTCNQDTIEQVSLDAGGTYQKDIILYVSDLDQSGQVTFRMGFKHTLENGDEMEPVWSEPVTMDVLVPGAEGKASAYSSDNASSLEVSEAMPDEDELATDPDTGVDPEIAQSNL